MSIKSFSAKSFFLLSLKYLFGIAMVGSALLICMLIYIKFLY